MIFIGADPGSRVAALAAVDSVGAPVVVQVLRAKGKAAMIQQVADTVRTFLGNIHDYYVSPLSPGYGLAAIEDQEYRHGRAKGSPSQLFPVAQVAGALFAEMCEVVPCRFVTPTDWKGSVPKIVHHRRLLKALGWAWDESGTADPYLIPHVPTNLWGADVRNPEWPDVLDAIGLARWAREAYDP
jgi:hypothetical protein